MSMSTFLMGPQSASSSSASGVTCEPPTIRPICGSPFSLYTTSELVISGPDAAFSGLLLARDRPGVVGAVEAPRGVVGLLLGRLYVAPPYVELARDVTYEFWREAAREPGREGGAANEGP
jgi:hypothetical protein